MSAAVQLPPPSMGQPPDRGSQMSANDLAGPSTSPLPGRQEQAKAFMDRIRQFHIQLDDFARQFPAFSKYAQKAQDVLVEGMTDVASKMNTPDQPGPRLVG